ncbi:MAG: hypothetical protein ACT4OJ_12920 [Bacteroidota bacterium]
MKPKYLILAILLLLITLAGCYNPKFGVASARITITEKGIHIQLLEKLRRLKDTTFIAEFISRMR